MKTLENGFRIRIKYIVLLSTILGAVLLISYASIANARRAETQEASSTAGVLPDAEETNPEYIQRRREFFDRFFGDEPGGVSSDTYGTAPATARALPLSPLVQQWTFQALAPLGWGNGIGASARIDAIAVHPTNADIVYVGSEGGLSKSTDGGEHWSYLSDSLPSQSIRSIAIDPVAPNKYTPERERIRLLELGSIARAIRERLGQ